MLNYFMRIASEHGEPIRESIIGGLIFCFFPSPFISAFIFGAMTNSGVVATLAAVTTVVVNFVFLYLKCKDVF